MPEPGLAAPSQRNPRAPLSRTRLRAAHWPQRVLGALLLAVLAGVPALALATLPPVVDGQPLPSLAPMLAKVTPAVVNISSKTHVRVRNSWFADPFLQQFLGGGVPRERIEQSLGSGVIVDADKGYVLTNNHVVDGADSITVTLQDGRDFKAKLIGADPDTDIAVLQIPARHLQALALADSSTTRVGDFVVAVGDPFGLGQTVTSGIVSALNRSGLGKTYQNFIQTDAPINPGNSGGALVNLRGELVGINSMIYSPSGASAGIGFAIPINLAQRVMGQLLTYGKVRRGSLGLDVQDLTPRIAQALGRQPGSGVVVTHVTRGSPADQAGVQIGDVLTALNGKAVHGADDLHNAEGLLPVGSAAELNVQRDGKATQIRARIEPEKLATLAGGELDPRLAGSTLSDQSQSQRSQSVPGVAVTRVTAGSRAAASDIQTGDVIVGVNQRRVTSLKTLQTLLAGSPPRQLMLVIARGNNLIYRLPR